MRGSFKSWLRNRANRVTDGQTCGMSASPTHAKMSRLGAGPPTHPAFQGLCSPGVLNIPNHRTATRLNAESLPKGPFRTLCQVIKPGPKSLANVQAVFLRNVLLRKRTKILCINLKKSPFVPNLQLQF